MNWIAFILFALAVRYGVHAVQIGTIRNASLLSIPQSNFTLNGSSCEECLCTLLLSTNDSSTVSINCYTTGIHHVDCQVFTLADYESFSFYGLTISNTSTFFFLQLPSSDRSQLSTTESTSTTSSSTIPLTTTQRPIVTITRAGDNITGVYNTTAGGSTGGKNGRYASAAESPAEGIDNLTSTKYLNFGTFGNFNLVVLNAGAGSGYYVTPAVSNATVAVGLRFATGNDAPDRDPISTTLEGTNADDLDDGSSWTLLYNGSTGINPSVDPGRGQYLPEQYFVNTVVYKSYRLLITAQRAPEWCVQYAEAQILGYVY